MKVYQGKYIEWFGPYQLAEKLCFWAKKVPNRYGILEYPEWVHNFGTWLAKDKDGNDSWLMKLFVWYYNRRKRKIKVRIDYYDTWNMPGNLAYIILPMLKQIRKERDSSPKVDNEDVPEELRSTSDDEWEVDENWHKRWDWVLDEVIWAFEHLHPDNHWEENFRYKNGEYNLEEIKKCDERIVRGTTLFGKYFQHFSN